MSTASRCLLLFFTLFAWQRLSVDGEVVFDLQYSCCADTTLLCVASASVDASSKEATISEGGLACADRKSWETYPLPYTKQTIDDLSCGMSADASLFVQSAMQDDIFGDVCTYNGDPVSKGRITYKNDVGATTAFVLASDDAEADAVNDTSLCGESDLKKTCLQTMLYRYMGSREVVKTDACIVGSSNILSFTLALPCSALSSPGSPCLNPILDWEIKLSWTTSDTFHLEFSYTDDDNTANNCAGTGLNPANCTVGSGTISQKTVAPSDLSPIETTVTGFASNAGSIEFGVSLQGGIFQPSHLGAVEIELTFGGETKLKMRLSDSGSSDDFWETFSLNPKDGTYQTIDKMSD